MKNGLLSAIVATFLTLSLPQLLPDSGLQTVALLTQLVNISTGAPVEVQNSPPFHPRASVVRVNVLWILSLILSLCCALLTTSMQQSARVYLDYAQHRSSPRKRARIREYMFEGVADFRLSRTVGTMPFLLHISVFLFLNGLIEFLYPFNTVVANYTLDCVLVFESIYAILTLLPIWRPNCPYRTPLSEITYFSFQLSASALFSAAKAIEVIFHGLLLKIWRWFHPDVQESPNDWPTKWREMLEEKVSTHYERLLHGLRWRVVLSAMEAPSSVDASALYWTLTTLDEDMEFEEFAARMPGFFDSRSTPDATSAMLSLMSDQSISEPILGSRLRGLLGTCLPGSSPLTEERRSNRLRVCLTSLWYCLRAYNLPENSEVPLASYVRAIFASPQVLRWLQTEVDPATRLLGRCFESLVVKKLANDITLPTRTNMAASTAELACLSYILGATGEQVRDWLGQEGAIDLVNVISLASGEFETLVASVTVTKGDVVDVFQQTLGILAEGIVSSHTSAEWNPDDLPLDQVAQFRKIYFKFANARLPDVLKQRLRYISDRLPLALYVERPKMEMPSPELDSEIAPLPGPSQNLSVRPVRDGDVPDSSVGDGIGSTPTRD